jgi:AAA family ATP:ADP antiporter
MMMFSFFVMMGMVMLISTEAFRSTNIASSFLKTPHALQKTTSPAAMFSSIPSLSSFFHQKNSNNMEMFLQNQNVSPMSTTALAATDTPAAEQVGFKQTERKTLKKLLPLGAMLFFILFNYTILRDTKDVLVVTAPNSGAEIIPFLKTYVNLPSAIGFTILYSSLTNKMPADKVFYVIMASFLSFFGAFATIIYPNRNFLHPNAAADFLTKILPTFFVPLIAIFRNWTYALFYTLANLWGSVVVSLLFWGFANEITTVDEAKKYYPLFGLMANVALIFSGQYVKYVSNLRSGLPAGADYWGHSLKMLMGAVVAGGAVVVSLMMYMQKFVLTDPGCIDPNKEAKRKKTKTKMTFGESAKFLASSRYIRDLAVIVIGYGMAINIVEVTWKSKLKAAFPDPNAYSTFMGNFSSATGIVTLLMMFGSSFLIKRFGMGVASLITPITLLTTGIAFFSLIMFPGFFSPLTSKFGVSPLMLAVLIGAAQNILSKGSKYSLFDPCKEMAYIPLDAESKTKGKAAVDVIGNPLGKSGGSFLQQILIGIFGSLQASTPYLGGFLGLIIVAWIQAAGSLAQQFKVKNDEMERASKEWPLKDFEKKEQ